MFSYSTSGKGSSFPGNRLTREVFFLLTGSFENSAIEAVSELIWNDWIVLNEIVILHQLLVQFPRLLFEWSPWLAYRCAAETGPHFKNEYLHLNYSLSFHTFWIFFSWSSLSLFLWLRPPDGVVLKLLLMAEVARFFSLATFGNSGVRSLKVPYISIFWQIIACRFPATVPCDKGGLSRWLDRRRWGRQKPQRQRQYGRDGPPCHVY